MHGRVLIIAGSDSGGGAGIQADIKTVTLCGGYAMTAITALTAQNTLGVHGILAVPPSFIAQQIQVVLDDIGADCIKIGMLHDVATIETVADCLPAHIPLVVDPVMRAKGGAILLESQAVDALKRLIIPRASLLTPNLPELEALGGVTAFDCPVLIKGGHGEGNIITDRLINAEGEIALWEATRIDSLNTHGTGCTLASAIATGLAQDMTLVAAITRAHHFVQEAIRTAPHYGKGHGPLNHGWIL